MASVPFGADGNDYLTPGELKILARIERDLSCSDPRLVEALSVGVRPVPAWLIAVARAALLLIVLVLLLPFVVWSSIVVLAALILGIRVLQHALHG
jgi:Protein of unknown function (DUF3040)